MFCTAIVETVASRASLREAGQPGLLKGGVLAAPSWIRSGRQTRPAGDELPSLRSSHRATARQILQLRMERDARILWTSWPALRVRNALPQSWRLYIRRGYCELGGGRS